jgi:general secretion pathway protein A
MIQPSDRDALDQQRSGVDLSPEPRSSFLEFYGLQEQPFGATADPDFMYQSAVHMEALECLLHGIRNDLGFSALIAEPGLGKTTLLVHLLKMFRNTALTAFIFETQCSAAGFVRSLLRELNLLPDEKDPVVLRECLNEALVAAARAGRRVLVVVDEAQNLDPLVLESVRLLSNLESRRGKLLHIVLSGQPQLADRLNRPDLVQLRQRIWLMAYLSPLPPDELPRYVEHRLRVAGHSGEGLFSDAALETIANRSRGIPREINRICFNALTRGFALGQTRISREIAEEACNDSGMRWPRLQRIALTTAGRSHEDDGNSAHSLLGSDTTE